MSDFHRFVTTTGPRPGHKKELIEVCSYDTYISKIYVAKTNRYFYYILYIYIIEAVDLIHK